MKGRQEGRGLKHIVESLCLPHLNAIVSHNIWYLRDNHKNGISLTAVQFVTLYEAPCAVALGEKLPSHRSIMCIA